MAWKYAKALVEMLNPLKLINFKWDHPSEDFNPKRDTYLSKKEAYSDVEEWLNEDDNHRASKFYIYEEDKDNGIAEEGVLDGVSYEQWKEDYYDTDPFDLGNTEEYE